MNSLLKLFVTIVHHCYVRFSGLSVYQWKWTLYNPPKCHAFATLPLKSHISFFLECDQVGNLLIIVDGHLASCLNNLANNFYDWFNNLPYQYNTNSIEAPYMKIMEPKLSNIKIDQLNNILNPDVSLGKNKNHNFYWAKHNICKYLYSLCFLPWLSEGNIAWLSDIYSRLLNLDMCSIVPEYFLNIWSNIPSLANVFYKLFNLYIYIIVYEYLIDFIANISSSEDISHRSINIFSRVPDYLRNIRVNMMSYNSSSRESSSSNSSSLSLSSSVHSNETDETDNTHLIPDPFIPLNSASDMQRLENIIWRVENDRVSSRLSQVLNIRADYVDIYHYLRAGLNNSRPQVAPVANPEQTLANSIWIINRLDSLIHLYFPAITDADMWNMINEFNNGTREEIYLLDLR